VLGKQASIKVDGISSPTRRSQRREIMTQHEMQTPLLSATSKTETEVLIVGGGPTGLVMACELQLRGIRSRCIDQAAGPATTSRALAIHARTLEVFEQLGIVEKILAAAVKTFAMTVYDEGGRVLLHLDLQRAVATLRDVPYPYVLILPQSQTERLLRERLAELGGSVEWKRELVTLRQDEQGVSARVQVKDEGTEQESIEEIRAQWVIGCDGAHSRVRHLAGIPFEGKTLEVEFVLADVDLDWDKARDTTHSWLHKHGLFAAFPLPNSQQWRLFADFRSMPGQQVPTASLELFQHLLAERAGDGRTTISHPTWLSNFRINQRLVTTYRKGRIFLAGDAAHLHSPTGGQGMNTGIQDAYNLAWKLALVLQGKAGEALLNTYEEERKPVARQVVGTTGPFTELLTSQNPLMRFLLEHLVFPLLHTDLVQARLAKGASGLNVNYRTSSLSGSHKGATGRRAWWPKRKPADTSRYVRKAPRAGDRAPQASARHYPDCAPISVFELCRDIGSHVLIFAGPTASAEDYTRLVRLVRRMQGAWGEDVQTHLVLSGSERPETLDENSSLLLDPQLSLHTAYGVREETLYVLRPDGYIGFRSQPASEEALFKYLGRLFLPAGPRRADDLIALSRRSETTLEVE
jgi:2-polyprenyl-6-methoxyphenol hydroxylase-like FAD-dependent oxidoreductase